MHVEHFAAVFGSNLCGRDQLAWTVLNMGKKPDVSRKVKGEPQRKDKKEKRSQKDTKKTSGKRGALSPRWTARSVPAATPT